SPGCDRSPLSGERRYRRRGRSRDRSAVLEWIEGPSHRVGSSVRAGNGTSAGDPLQRIVGTEEENRVRGTLRRRDRHSARRRCAHRARHIVASTRSAIARSGFGLAIRRGAPKPDLRTVDALKSALLSAKSIAFAKEGAGGLFFTALITRLGLADQLAPKLRPTVTGTDVSEAVARGRAEFGVQLISEILFVPGVELGGSFPPPVQAYSIMVGGV